MGDDIKLDESYDQFLQKNQENAIEFDSMNFIVDDYSSLSVKTNMSEIEDKLNKIYYKYQGISRVDAVNFAKLGEQFEDLDRDIANDLSTTVY